MNIALVMKLMTIKVGDSICDMHYGGPSGSFVTHVPVTVGAAKAVIASVKKEYTNKMLVVVGIEDELITAAYSYDDRRAGIISFDMAEVRGAWS